MTVWAGSGSRNARVSMPAASRTTWPKPSPAARVTSWSKNQVRGPMDGFSAGEPGGRSSSIHRNPSWPASARASGSSNSRSGRRLSSARPAAAILAVIPAPLIAMTPMMPGTPHRVMACAG